MDDIFNVLFPNYTVSSIAKRHFNIFINTYEDEVELGNVIKLLKSLVPHTVKSSTISEEDAIRVIVETKQELANINNKSKSKLKENQKKVIEKSFKELINHENITISDSSLLTLSTKDLIKYEFVYKNAIVYLDSYDDLKYKKTLTQLSNMLSNTNNKHNHISKIAFPDSIDKTNMFLNHFNFIKHFLFKHKFYKNPLNKSKEAIPVYSLDCLEGNPNRMVIIGMLKYSEDGKLQIEDETMKVNLDLSNLQYEYNNQTQVYFTEGSVVLMEGRYNNRYFKAEKIIQPPSDLNEKEKMEFSEKVEEDFFGAITKIIKNFNLKEDVNNKENPVSIDNFVKKANFTNKVKSYFFPLSIEKSLKQNMNNLEMNYYNSRINAELFKKSNDLIISSEQDVIIISNINLSDDLCLSKLKYLFTQFEASPPALFILIGNFLPDSSFNSFLNQTLYFESLSNLIEINEKINNTSVFCIVPGINDISISSSLPLPKLPDFIEEILRKKIKNLIMATNPCRFSVFGKELVIFRDELHKKLSRYSLNFNLDIINNSDRLDLLLNTIQGQRNLSPLLQEYSSRIWDLSSSFLLFPLPDYLIIGEMSMGYSKLVNNTTYINPGNFSKDYSFVHISPLTGEVQELSVKF